MLILFGAQAALFVVTLVVTLISDPERVFFSIPFPVINLPQLGLEAPLAPPLQLSS